MGARDQAAGRRSARCRRGAPIPPHGVFKNDPRLSQTEIDTIAAWVDAGAPKGDDRDCRRRRSSPRAGRSASPTRSSR